MALAPRAILRVYNSDVAAFGRVLYNGDTLSYDLPGLMGTPGTAYQGFQRDPTGRYLCQQIVLVPFDAPPSAWTLGAGGALPASFSFGTDASSRKKFLYHGSPTDAFNVKLTQGRAQDEGFAASFYIAAASAAAAVNFYVEFSRGRLPDQYGDYDTGLRLAFEPGAPIRLQASYDGDATWTDVATADAAGECEAYLDRNGRTASVSVLAMCDAAWQDGLPDTLAQGGSPPNRVVVSLGGGDATLEFTDDRLAAGQMAVTGQNRQWSVRPYLLRHAVAGSVVLAPQTRPSPLLTTPSGFLNGYVPPGDGIAGAVVLDTPASAHVVLTLSATPDATGFSPRSCFLATVDAEFPPLQIYPADDPGYTDYEAVYSQVSHTWDQTTGVYRSVASLTFTNNQDQYAPGVLVDLAVRAAALFHSLDPGARPDDFAAGTVLEDIGGTLFALEMTGYTAMEEEGQGWTEEGNLKWFTTSLSDRLVHTEADTAICCGYQLPYDFQCQYYAFGQQAYRAAFTDADWNFPQMARNAGPPPGTNYYYLDGGTTLNPVHRFQPDDTLGMAMGHIREAGAELAPGGVEPQPMVYGTEADGSLSFYGLPVGVVDCLLNAGQTLAGAGLSPVKVFSATPGFNPDGTPALNEFQQRWSSRTSLRRVRTPVVLCGLDPQTGAVIFGVAYNETVGGGPYANPSAPGYIGVNKPLYVISRLYSSQAVADLSARKAAILLAIPAVDTGGTLLLQPGFRTLMVFAVADYSSQGTDGAVGYYSTHVTSIVDRRSPRPKGETTLFGRILGQAA